MIDDDDASRPVSSAVLFLLGEPPPASGASTSPCLILNKRSQQIRQPGDLCFPGGNPIPRIDAVFARLLRLPGFPFGRWRAQIKHNPSQSVHGLTHLLATCLRESFEEMGLIPLGVRFLGPLPCQHLAMFNRTIYPMVGWTQYQKRFRLNSEVEKLVYIPIENLLNPDNYAFFQVGCPAELPTGINAGKREFPCFVHRKGRDVEILWGATYRIVMTFLAQIFDFSPPETSQLQKIENPLPPNYFNRRF